MQEFNSCEISSRISGNLQKDLVVLRNQSSHWQHTNPSLYPKTGGYTALQSRRSAAPAPEFLSDVPAALSCHSSETSPWEYRHILQGCYQALTQNSPSLVPRFPPPTHICCFGWWPLSLLLSFSTYPCKKHLNEHL